MRTHIRWLLALLVTGLSVFLIACENEAASAPTAPLLSTPQPAERIPPSPSIRETGIASPALHVSPTAHSAVTPAQAPAGSKGVLTVGTKDFTEQFLIGQMYVQLLRQAGFEVRYKEGLGGTPVTHPALVNGEIDLYPEYTGTGLLVVLKLPLDTSAGDVYARVATGYREQFNLIWLTPAPMNNTQALAMRRERADELGIFTISDMVRNADKLVLAGPYEFPEREDGLPGLKRVYGDFTLKGYKSIDKGLRYQTLMSGEADVIVAFGTDGEIEAFNLRVLEDDKGLFPPYQVAPVVRASVLEAYPEVVTILNALSPHLTSEVMRKLNYEVIGKKREPAEVAREFLIAKGLLKP